MITLAGLMALPNSASANCWLAFAGAHCSRDDETGECGAQET